jgi:hypothetical protein
LAGIGSSTWNAQMPINIPALRNPIGGSAFMSKGVMQTFPVNHGVGRAVPARFPRRKIE